MLVTLVAVFSVGSLGCVFLLWKYKKRIKGSLRNDIVLHKVSINQNIYVLISPLQICPEHFKQRSQQEEMTAFFGSTEVQEEAKDAKQYELRSFSLRDMVAATDNFSYENLLGEGGFGPVYKVYVHPILLYKI